MARFYRWNTAGELLLYCHLQPKASKDEFAGDYDGRLKIRIQAAPVDGKANAALLKFIAKQFLVAKSRVSLCSGDASRRKTVCIQQPGRLPTQLGIIAPA
jgi:hypothetical protein